MGQRHQPEDAVDGEHQREQAAAEQVERERERPEAAERGDAPRPVRIEYGSGGVGEVLVEQLHAAGDEEHDADAERERAGEPEYPPFLSIQQQE